MTRPQKYAYQHCHSFPHRCRPCSRDQHRTASGSEYSVHSYMRTGPGHTSDHSRAKETSQPIVNTDITGSAKRIFFLFQTISTDPTSSDPSAQSWSPSHFHLPAMQRPLVQANSLSEHCRGTTEEHKACVTDNMSTVAASYGRFTLQHKTECNNYMRMTIDTNVRE